MDDLLNLADFSLDLDDNIEVVAAIDFGTTFSGYAYSYSHSPDIIHLNRGWASNSFKTPTVIMFDCDQNFKLFGRPAEQEACDNPNHNGYYFKTFKMALYDENISRYMMIKAENGKKMRALDVFSAAIRYLKDHFLAAINKRSPGSPLDMEAVRWVLTVPAIWSEKAKQFMREAGEKAGITSKNLHLALEPECASFHCKTKKVSDYQKNLRNEVGSKYIVLDNGGGTIDVTVHQIDDNKKLKSLHMPTGGAWGGSKVNNRFEAYMEMLLTPKVAKNIKQDYPYHWLKIMREFEDIKVTLDDIVQDHYNLLLTNDVLKTYKEIQKVSIHDDQTFRFRSCGAYIQGEQTLKIPRTVIVDMIKRVSQKIKQHTKDLLKDCDLKEVDFIYLVGGFSNSEIVRNDIDSLHIAETYWPEDSQLAVLKGAVIYGWNPNMIITRRSMKTYGTDITPNFVKGVHPENLKFLSDDGEERCKKVFSTFVTKNQEIYLGKEGKISKIFYPVEKNQNSCNFAIYSSKKEKVVYANEEDCIEVGSLNLPMPILTGGTNRKIHVDIYFGGTEMQLDVLDETSGTKKLATFDFLSR